MAKIAPEDTACDTAPVKLRDGTISPPRLWGWHTFISGAGTLIIFGVLAAFVDWQSVWREFLRSHKGYIFLGMACHYLTYPVRGLRWRRGLVHLPICGSWAQFGIIVFFYNFVDNLVPGKLGDLYAAHLARINFGIRRSAAIGSIVFLRMLDAWIVLALAMLASFAMLSGRLPYSVRWALIGGGIIAFAATVTLLTFLILNRSLPRWIPEKIKPMIQAFNTGMWPRTRELPAILGLSAVIWGLETFWIFFLLIGFDQVLNSSEILFLTMVPLLASAFPFTPSGAGVVEVTLYNCLRIVGLTSPLAGSITVLNRFIDYWLHIALGGVVWTMRRRLKLRTWHEEAAVKKAGGRPSFLSVFKQE
jgi:uncharacterized protein (TIRG00374 family)